jgi:hypothetical protein
MCQRLKISVPALQVILALGVFTLSKIAHNEAKIDALLVLGIVKKINFGLACLYCTPLKLDSSFR